MDDCKSYLNFLISPRNCYGLISEMLFIILLSEFLILGDKSVKTFWRNKYL